MLKLQKKHAPHVAGIVFLLLTLVFTTLLFIQSNSSLTFASAPVLTTVDSTGSVGQFTSIGIGTDGYARMVYYDTTNDDLKFAQCTNDSCSTKNLTTIDSTVTDNPFGSLVIAADGYARIAYWDATGFDLEFIQCTNDECSTKVSTTIDSTGNVGQYAAITMGADGYPRISYSSENTDLKFAQCTNDACSTNVLTLVDTVGTVGKYSSIAMGADGYARISYEDSTNSYLKMAQCTNDACSTNVLTAVDTAGSGRDTSIAIASGDDFARISYYDTTNNDLKYAQCTNAACSTNVITTVDSSSDARYTSLRLGSDGFGRISYQDSSNSDLQFAQCTNAACSTNSIMILDGIGGTTGSYTSLALGSDGFPRISYYHDSNADLKVVQCTDASCGTAPTAPTTLYANTYANGAQSGSANPTSLDSKDIVVSAIHNDSDAEATTVYQLQLATDDAFSSVVYDSGANGTTITSTANGARTPNLDIPFLVTEDTTYYWRIRFRDPLGNWGAYSPSGGSAATLKTSAGLTPVINMLDSTGTVGLYNSTAVAADGFSRIAYYDANAIGPTTLDLKFIQCTNASCTTKNTTTVDSTGSVGQYASLKIASDGFARIAYLDSTNTSLKYVQCTNAACSTSNITTVENTASVGHYASLALDSSDFGLIAYHDASSQDLKFAQCTNAACSTSNITQVETSGNMGQYASVTVATDGFARIAHIDPTNYRLRFIQCTNAACSTSVATIADSTGLISGNPTSITMAADGFARIGYINQNIFKFLQCTNADCSASVITTVDGSGISSSSGYSTIVMAADGFARIAYYNSTNTALKYAKCTNAACSTSAITTINSVGLIGLYSSLGLNPDGYPHISYYDGTNLDLRFAQCTNATCTAIPPNSAPSAPTTLYVNTASATAQSGFGTADGSRLTLVSDSIVFSALYNDDDSGDIADQYQLQVDTTNDFSSETLSYDSGSSGTAITNITEGDRSTDITPTGFTPVADTLYYWRLKFWDDDDTEGDFSPSGGSAASFTYSPPTITFDIDTATTDTESAAPYTVALGTLSPSSITTSDRSTINSIFLDLSSNATNGTTITVLGSNGGLYSATANHTITLETTESTITAGEEKFGLCVASATKTGGAGTFSASSTYDANGDSNCTISNGGTPTIGKLNTEETSIVSTDGTITGGRVEILTKASITPTTPAGSDYSEVFTFVATGVY